MRYRKMILTLIVIVVIILIAAVAIGSFSSDDSSLSEEPKGDASVVVTGDVMFARKMPSVLSSDSNPFAGVDNVTSNADILLINFENAATSTASAVKGDVPLKTSPDLVKLAHDNENTVAALANNHAFDYGIDGMHDTKDALKNNNISAIGAGDNAAEAHQPYSKDVNGRNITIFNYMDSNNFKEYSNDVMPVANDTSPGYSAYDKDVATKQIQDAKNNGSDIVIVYMHYGNEYSRSPNDDQKAISHELIDAGADVVLGSHPHVTQGIEVYNGKPIFYSLGNFIFDQSNSATHRAYFVEMDFVNDTGECTVYPVDIVNYLPQFMSASDGQALLQELNPQCDQLQITDEGTGKLTFNLTDS